MSTPITSTSTNRAGLCPHGLPPAACPICSGGAMSGGGKAKDMPATKPINTQWSFMKCYAAGLAIKAREARTENAKTVFEKQIEFAKQLHSNIQKIAENIKTAIENIKNSVPNFLANIVQFSANTIIFPIINLISQIPKLIEKLAQFQQTLGNMLLQAGEKLAALLGDLKNFIQRRIFENIKKQTKKIFMFFISNTEDENYRNDETLAIFKSREIKKYLVKIFGITKRQDNNANRSIKNK